MLKKLSIQFEKIIKIDNYMNKLIKKSGLLENPESLN